MTKDQLSDLAIAVAKAGQAGKEAADACDNDGGTCNLDCVYLYDLKRMKVETLRAAGINCYKWSPGVFHLRSPFGGMANRNTVGVQAMYKSLVADGVKCSIHYQMD